MQTFAPGCDVTAWRCTRPLEPDEHRRLCREMALEAFKWDAQVGDVTTLADFAVVLPRPVWRELARAAEALAAELLAAETELAARPELWPELGLPRRVRAALASNEPWTPTAARVIRFDFHPTAEGWRVSEANSDVPGGYTEAGVFAQRVAALIGNVRPAGDPAAVLCDALTARAQAHGRIVLLAAPGYAEDLQVVGFLSAMLRARGLSARVARPEQLSWDRGIAHVAGTDTNEPVDVVFRFYQGEWMTRVAGDGWRFLFRGGRTAVCNPASALLGESKRLPALFDELDTAMPAWRELVPCTRRADVRWANPSRQWVLKRSYSNNGDDVVCRSWSRKHEYAWALAHALLAPAEWSAQARFETQLIATPAGPMHPCIGVYVVNGQACGLYGRLSAQPVIDFRAVETAVLVEE